jgi:hypothetical protein
VHRIKGVTNQYILLVISNTRFNSLGSVITNDARCTCEIVSGIDIAKAAFNKDKTLFHQLIGLTFKQEANKVLHLEHSFVWC